MCPIKKFFIPSKPILGINNETVTIMHERDKLYHLAHRTNCEDTWNIARFFRNQAEQLLRNCKVNYLKEQLHLNKKNPKRLWGNIRQLIPGKSQSSSNTITLYDKDKACFVDPVKLPNYINDYFSNIGQ